MAVDKTVVVSAVPSSRPDRIVLVCGTGTEVGKTWVGSRLLEELRRRGLTVAARKPAQSFDVDSEGSTLGGPTDAEVLAEASGEDPETVCASFRSYHRAMAPPMAAEALGRPGFTVAELVAELNWPPARVSVGLVETAGGVRSPQASDGDGCDLLATLVPDAVVLVADAGLGTINDVRLAMDALTSTTSTMADIPIVVVLDRFDGRHEIHRRNRDWLTERDSFRVLALPGEEVALADEIVHAGPPSTGVGSGSGQRHPRARAI